LAVLEYCCHYDDGDGDENFCLENMKEIVELYYGLDDTNCVYRNGTKISKNHDKFIRKASTTNNIVTQTQNIASGDRKKNIMK
jgi:hypothetical protein